MKATRGVYCLGVILGYDRLWQSVATGPEVQFLPVNQAVFPVSVFITPFIANEFYT
jgi:hypothetical protein